MNQDKTVSQRFRDAITDFKKISENGIITSGRSGMLERQNKIFECLKEFTLIRYLVNQLDLFSQNESLKEINYKYIPFLGLNYYLGCLYMNYLFEPHNPPSDEEEIDLAAYKEQNLVLSKELFISFLLRLDSYGSLLKSAQTTMLERMQNEADGLTDFHTTAAEKRAAKIENYRTEKTLENKLRILDDIESKEEKDGSHPDDLDEENIRQIYLDELKLLAMKAFDNLQLIFMELEVISHRPKYISQHKNEGPKSSGKDDFGYTTKLESLPSQATPSSLLSKQGRILQPFTIVPDKLKIKEQVFGTGQVLPSMSVEEYLDWELANGKLLKAEDPLDDDDKSDDSADELEKRRWDDWKDSHPKGSGNMKGNIG